MTQRDEPDLGPDALAYWRAGLSPADAELAAKLAARWLREQREALARAAAQAGELCEKEVAMLFGDDDE